MQRIEFAQKKPGKPSDEEIEEEGTDGSSETSADEEGEETAEESAEESSDVDVYDEGEDDEHQPGGSNGKRGQNQTGTTGHSLRHPH